MAELNKELPPEFWDLGFLDDETAKIATSVFDMGDGLKLKIGKPKVKFKTLGAKRYIYEGKNGVVVTVAGLPKNALQKYCNRINKDIFEVFSTFTQVPFDESDKLTTAYNDEETIAVVNGEEMRELSSVALYEIPFTMRVLQNYIDFYKWIKKENRKVM